MKLILVSLAFLLSFLAFSGATLKKKQYVDCGGSGTINDATISPPCPKEPCEFKLGTTGKIGVNFTVGARSQQVSAALYVIVLGEEVPVTMVNPDVCTSGVACPVVPGKTYFYTAKVFIQPSYPTGITAKGQLQLLDDNLKKIVCGQITGKLVE